MLVLENEKITQVNIKSIPISMCAKIYLSVKKILALITRVLREG